MRWATYRQVTITDVSTLVCGPNPHRRYLKISNADLSNNVWFAFGIQATANQSFVVADFSPSEEFRVEDLGNLLTQAVFGVTITGQSLTVAVCEAFEQASPDERTVGQSEAPFGMS